MKLNVDLSALHRCVDQMVGRTNTRGGSRDACPECDGWGMIWEGGMSLNPEVDNERACPRCNGSGEPD
jgi:DnaJ-class molecular chaperone